MSEPKVCDVCGERIGSDGSTPYCGEHRKSPGFKFEIGQRIVKKPMSEDEPSFGGVIESQVIDRFGRHYTVKWDSAMGIDVKFNARVIETFYEADV